MRCLPWRHAAPALAGALACLLLAGCGAGTKPNSLGGVPSATLLMAAPPNSLDPALGDTPEALEPDWLVYTPLLTYDHSSGVPGIQVIPGLASDPPTVTDSGRTYSLTLQPGLVYSNGQAVRASDFTWAVERAIRMGWSQADQLLTSRITGAAAFAAGRARTISGITTDDAAGQITVHLTAPWGPFDDVLALPVTAPIPRSTPMHEEPGSPPPGVGPYEFARVAPGHSFSLVLNPRWRRGQLPGIPAGHVDVQVRITRNAQLDASSVLSNTADVFDSADRIPSMLLARILRQAPERYSKRAINVTDLIFMNVTRPPFTSQLARIAVQTALDAPALKRLGADTLQVGCYLVPPSMWGHPHDQCPRGNVESGGDPVAARALVRRSGMAGSRITVWSAASPPASTWMAYYTALLNRIGFRARLRLVPGADYYATIGNLKLHPQTGFAELSPAIQSPVDLYRRLIGTGIRARANQNWGEVDDAYLNRQVGILASVPSVNLSAVAAFWRGLDRYVADRAYLAVFGYQTAPVFVSDRLEYSAIRLSPVAGLDWTSFHLR